jgi:hypothetical protein
VRPWGVVLAHQIIEMEGIDVAALEAKLAEDDKKTAEEDEQGLYEDHPRPGGARAAARRQLIEEDRLAWAAKK